MASSWWLPAVLLAGCAAPSPNVLLREGRLPAARVTTKSELVLTCTPSDAEVVLDGVPQGTCEDFGGAPRGLSLGKGVRRVEVRKPGYLSWNTVVETDGTRVQLDVTLLPTGSRP